MFISIKMFLAGLRFLFSIFAFEREDTRSRAEDGGKSARASLLAYLELPSE